MKNPIPVIDLFAGPGGLGEGFSSLSIGRQKKSVFKINLSIEKDPLAHQTLELRAFYRQFSRGSVPDDYYRHLRDPHTFTRGELFRNYPDQAKSAREESLCKELGKEPSSEIDRKIRLALNGNRQWVLIGGPPCQAYSLVGRSRTGGINPDDHRIYLYREYLRILAEHQPPIFVMENVKGILSSSVNGNKIFDLILKDLSDPCFALGNNNRNAQGYRLFSLVRQPEEYSQNDKPIFQPKDFVIECEKYGIPQSRHRVIVLGIRDDLDLKTVNILEEKDRVTAGRVLNDLPRLRSGISRSPDSATLWQELVERATTHKWFRSIQQANGSTLAKHIEDIVSKISKPRVDRGAEFIPCDVSCDYLGAEWFDDEQLQGVCNHSTRSHIPTDLHRYLFAACFAKSEKRSPTLRDFPSELLPEHKNVNKGVFERHFTDRFRVQLKNEPATTVTSHIAKDGHYYIHYDATQCRSLTVREAARLQTFPDNYFFCGPRTQQYAQVGNAVPPLLAKQIAEIVYGILESS